MRGSCVVDYRTCSGTKYPGNPPLYVVVEEEAGYSKIYACTDAAKKHKKYQTKGQFTILELLVAMGKCVVEKEIYDHCNQCCTNLRREERGMAECDG